MGRTFIGKDTCFPAYDDGDGSPARSVNTVYAAGVWYCSLQSRLACGVFGYGMYNARWHHLVVQSNSNTGVVLQEGLL